MNVPHLTKEPVSDLVFDGKYPLSPSEFTDPSDEEVEVVYEAAETYGFSVNGEKLKSVSKLKLKKNHYSAVVFCFGNYNIKDRYEVEGSQGKNIINILVIQKSLQDFRLKEISRKLIKDEIVELFPGCDEEYLYEVLTETAENILFEKIKEADPKLPVYNVNFSENGEFKILEMGRVTL